MPRRRALPKNTEVIMRGEPVLVNGGGTIKALCAEFLFYATSSRRSKAGDLTASTGPGRIGKASATACGCVPRTLESWTNRRTCSANSAAIQNRYPPAASWDYALGLSDNGGNFNTTCMSC
jgi:hypothetical protein